MPLAHDPGGPRRIHEVVARQARDAAHQPALIEAETTLGYGALDAAVEATAASMAGLGIGAGDRVMVVCENTIPAVVLILAASRRDAWAVPVNARLSAREIDAIGDHSGARRVFYTAGVSPEAAAHAARHGAEPFQMAGARAGAVAVGPAGSAAAEPAYDDPVRQVAVLMYTSGTTGAPKGVMLSHANLLFTGRIWAELRRATPADRLYAVLPISHIYGFANGVLGAFAAGASVELEPRFAPDRLYRALTTGTTVFQGVPTMFARLLEFLDASGAASGDAGGECFHAPRLRYISGGGAPVDFNLKRRVEAALGLPFLSGYGLTEASPTVAVMRIDDPRDDGSAGPPAPQTELRLVDPATGAEAGDGEIGELWVRGPQVMVGYYRDAIGTAAVLTPDRWLNTGDLARIDDGGAVWIVGRTRDVIIRSGFNVYPAEIEAVLTAHPAVTLCGVVGRAVDGNEEVIAFVQLATDSAATAARLGAYAAEHLAPYKRPARIVILDALPTMSSGKVRALELRRLAQDL